MHITWEHVYCDMQLVACVVGRVVLPPFEFRCAISFGQVLAGAYVIFEGNHGHRDCVAYSSHYIYDESKNLSLNMS